MADYTDYGFDNALNVDLAPQTSPTVYDTSNPTQSQAVQLGYIQAGADTTNYAVDPAQGQWMGAPKFADAKFSVTMGGLVKAVGIATLNMKAYTSFESSTRFTQTLVNAGTVSFGTDGVSVASSATITSSAKNGWAITYSTDTVYAGSPTFSCYVRVAEISTSTAGSAFLGLGQPTVTGSGHTFTAPHIGFKFVKSSGTCSLYATQADGVTESAILLSSGVVNGDTFDLLLKVNGSSSVDYYYRKIGGTLSAATTISTNLVLAPGETSASFSVSNNATAENFVLVVYNASYER